MTCPHVREYDATSETARRMSDALWEELQLRYGFRMPNQIPLGRYVPPDGGFWVAEVDGEPVGSMALAPLEDGVGELDVVYVAPEHRGRGVAQALLARAEARARSRGLRALRLRTGRPQPESLRFYAAAGFLPIERYGHWADDETAVCLEKRLGGQPWVPVLTTARLVLRGFRDEDRAPFARMNDDPVVTATLVRRLRREESDAFVDRIAEQWAAHGWGLWALQRRDTGAFVGHTGLWPVRFDAPFQPRVEVGWRLAAEHWGLGLASEAGRAALSFAFDVLGLEEVVSFTAASNRRSVAVMERLGMRRDRDGDFEHPSVPEGHPLRPHVLYRARPVDRQG